MQRFVSIASLDTKLFLGRDAECARALACLQASSSLHISGPAGVGKSALARVLAKDWSQMHPETASHHFALHEVRDFDSFRLRLRLEWSLQPAPQDEHITAFAGRIAQALRHRGPALVVLDDADHILELLPDLWQALAPCDEVRLVVTTRQGFGAPPASSVRLEPLIWEEALELFVALAHQRHPTWEMSVEEADALREVLGLFDPVPLLIELMAARLPLLPPSIWRERMPAQFELIKSTRPGLKRPDLHTVLQVTWESLSPEERGLLKVSSVFPGSFTLQELEALLQDAHDLATLSDLLEALHAKALVRILLNDRRQPHLELYRNVRLFVRAEFSESEALDLRTRHARHISDWAQNLARDAPTTTANIGDRARRFEDLMQAMNVWQQSDPEQAAKLLLCLHSFSLAHTPHRRYHERLHDLSARLEEPLLRGSLSRAQADVALRLGDFAQASEHLRRAEDLLNSLLPSEPALAPEDVRRALLEVAFVRARMHRLRSEHAASKEAATQASAWAKSLRDEHAMLQSSIHETLSGPRELQTRPDLLLPTLDQARRLQDKRTEATLLNILGVYWFQLGRYEEAHHYYSGALKAAQNLEEHQLKSAALSNLALIEHLRAKLPEAIEHSQIALQQARFQGDELEEHVILANLTSLLLDAERLEEAEASAERALSFLRLANQPRHLATALRAKASIAHHHGDLQHAQSIYEEALKVARVAQSAHAIWTTSFYLSVCLVQRMRQDLAREVLAHTLETVPSSPPGWWRALCQSLQDHLNSSHGPKGEARREDAPFGRPDAFLPPVLEQAFDLLEQARSARPTEETLLPWFLLKPLQDALFGGSSGVGASQEARVLLRLHHDGYFFELGDDARVDMKRRGPMRQLLVGLAQRNHEGQTGALRLEELFELGWPDEANIHPEAANKRVYAAIATLRKLGLGEHLLTTSSGYVLDPMLRVEVVSA